MVEALSSPFFQSFQDFVETLETSCLICSPYITKGPVERLIATVTRKCLQESLEVTVVTDLSVSNLIQGSTDVSALLSLTEKIENVNIIYLPRVHAKVYISGTSLAIVASANFTDGGAFTNLEYGVRVRDRALVRRIAVDIADYAQLGGFVIAERLRQLRGQIDELRSAVQEEQKSIKRKLRAVSVKLQRDAEDELLRVRVEGRSVNAIFEETILYLLARRSLATAELNRCVHDIHPDICDDTMDRVIDGQHFGKLWKHRVRTAQQHLKDKGLIDYDAVSRIWKCTR